MHFGAEEPRLVAALQSALEAAAPDLVVVSGDLTQRARERQFEAARRWLDALPAPHLVVPGNHDIPLFDLVRRILAPRERYRRLIGAPEAPLHVLPGVRVLGLDSTRRRTTGRLTPERLAPLARLAGGEPDDLRILVTHHPLVDKQLEGHVEALAAAAASRVDVLLAGHLHLSWRRRVKQDPGLGILQVQAGTATSHRLRQKEPVNSFNLLRWDGDTLEVRLCPWAGAAFVPRAPQRFRRGRERWQPA